MGLANFPILKKYYLNKSYNSAYVSENGKKRRIKINSKATFSNMKLSAAFHGSLSLNQQKKNTPNIKTNAISLCRCFKLFSFC